MCIIWKCRHLPTWSGVCHCSFSYVVMMIDTALERAVAVQETGPGRGQDHGHVAETMIVTGEDVADTAEAEVAAGVESGPRGGRERTNTAVDE